MNNMTFEEFKNKFEEIWFPTIDTARAEEYKLINLNASFWVTDCDTDEYLWADWFYNNYGVDVVEQTFCTSDITIFEKYYTKEVENLITEVFGEPYDQSGTPYCYWRVDLISYKTILDFMRKLMKLDRQITELRKEVL